MKVVFRVFAVVGRCGLSVCAGGGNIGGFVFRCLGVIGAAVGGVL